MSPIHVPTTGRASKAGPPRKPVDLVVVRQMLQRLVEQRPSKDSDQFRTVFRLFGRPKHGVTWEDFQRQVHTRLGIILTEAEARELFNQFDPEGKGTLSLAEVIERLLPPDYTAPSWNILRDMEATKKQEAEAKSQFMPYQATVPSSLKKAEWHLDDFVRELQRKIVERTKRPQDQYREAYVVFGKPEHGLTKDEFREMIFRLGMVVTDDQMDLIMDHFDTDKNGVLSFAELVRKVLPPDYTGRQWTEIRDDELMKESHARELRQMETTVKKWPKSLEATKPTIRKLKEQLATKILERTKRANDQYREAFQLFGSPKHGILFKDFKHQLRALGIVASTKALKALFKVLDVNKNGFISFQELVHQVLPKDYTAESWVERAERRSEEEQRQREAKFNPVLDHWPASLKHAQMTEDEVVALILKKIIERTKRPEDQYREAFKVFGSPHNGITEDELGTSLSRLGIVISKSMLHSLFAKWDENGNGLLEFSEFVSKVMPPDYTEKSWNIIRDEEAIARMEATRQAVLAESPFHSKPRATVKASTSARDAALSMRTDESTFEEADLEELMTPLPKEVLQRGMDELKRTKSTRRTKKRASGKRGRGKSDKRSPSRRGQGDVSMPLSTARMQLNNPATASRGGSSSRPKVKPLALPRVGSARKL